MQDLTPPTRPCSGMTFPMTYSGLYYFPVAWPILLLLIGFFFFFAVAMVGIRVLRFASASMGIGPGAMVFLLLLSLLGSSINIPIAYLPERVISTATEITYFGIRYALPVVREWPATMVAINVGGALIPIALSLYLAAKNRIYVLSAIGIAIVALVCYSLAEPVPGLGLAIPIFVPPLVTAVVAIILSRRFAGPLAYISGSLGTLIGADLLNLNKVQGLGTPVISIGGAGTFDGIFVTGLLAVISASLVTYRQGRHGQSAARWA